MDPSPSSAVNRDADSRAGSTRRESALAATKIIIGQLGVQAAFLLRVGMALQARVRWRPQ